jgi:hypothetical protein
MKNSVILRRAICFCLVMALLAIPAIAKESPWQTLDWPATGTPVLHFTFSKLKQLSGSGRMRVYEIDTVAENVSQRVISSAQFSIYLFDKDKARVGEDMISVSNVGPGETVKFQTTVSASGTPVSLTLRDSAKNPRTVSLTVNSTPQGAVLKVDGADVGTTPRNIDVGVGKHILTFSKEGFNAGNFPLEISPQDVSGGSVSYELGTSAFDSIELRDGSVLNGDLVSISGMDVEVRVGGLIQHIDRNKIKRVMLVQRDAPILNLPPASASGS